LIVDRFAAAGSRVIGTGRRCHQEIELSFGHDLSRLDRVDVLAIVPRFRMVSAVRFDCDVPMIHSDQIHLETEGRERATCAGAGAAGVAERVGNQHDPRF